MGWAWSYRAGISWKTFAGKHSAKSSDRHRGRRSGRRPRFLSWKRRAAFDQGSPNHHPPPRIHNRQPPPQQSSARHRQISTIPARMAPPRYAAKNGSMQPAGDALLPPPGPLPPLRKGHGRQGQPSPHTSIRRVFHVCVWIDSVSGPSSTGWCQKKSHKKFRHFIDTTGAAHVRGTDPYPQEHFLQVEYP